MNAQRRPLRRSLRDFHPLGIATLIGLALLVTAAYLRLPRWWLIWPGWAILGICIAIRARASTGPYILGFFFPAIAFLFSLSASTRTLHNIIALIVQPSPDHLFVLLSGRVFLFLVILYFASVCLFYGMEMRNCREDLEGCRQGRSQEDIDAERERRRWIGDDW
jgi:hypothetical protein